MRYRPRCPSCGSTEVMLEPGFEQGYEEKIDTTHRCANPKCNRRFRDTPPAHEEKTP